MTATVASRPPALDVTAPSPASRPTGGALRNGIGIGAATVIAGGANYLSNVVLGRGLDPREFADSALVVSSLMLLSALALGFQLVTARAVASGARSEAVSRLRRIAVLTGSAIGLALVAGSPVLASTFNMSSIAPLIALAAGVPIFLLLAVGRGVAQATGSFGRLAASISIEATARFVITIAAVEIGLGATGAGLALSASFAAAIVPLRNVVIEAGTALAAATRSRRATTATVLMLTGQVMVTNGDLWVVAALLPDQAGTYAAVSLIGRLVFVAAWSVVTVVFPSLVSNGGPSTDRQPLLARAVLATVMMGATMTLAAWWGGDRLIGGLLGAGYEAGGALLGPYALATTLFVLANLLAVADVGAGRLRGPSVVLVAGSVQTVVLLAGASAGIAWVVWAQVWVMAAILMVQVGLRSLASMSRTPSRHRA